MKRSLSKQIEKVIRRPDKWAKIQFAREMKLANKDRKRLQREEMEFNKAKIERNEHS